ncbi:MAG: ABC transporter permease [Alphaproteobacteria bacterium]|nr:MAG: ABC transporter permease [Alphaproteobacteria bacterium]
MTAVSTFASSARRNGAARSAGAWPRFGMVTVIALRNLVHDRIRLAVTLIGLVFALVLINVQTGLLLGFFQTTASIVLQSKADLWIVAAGTRNVDQSIPISERKLYQALAVPGVVAAAREIVEFALLKRPDGGSEGVLVVGFEVDGGLGGPWNVVEGAVGDLRYPNTIMVDELYRSKLGVAHVGDVVEINGYRARVVGFTRGIRSFTQAPYVFTSADNALDYARLAEDETKYILIDLVDGADVEAVQTMLTQRIRDVEVLTRDAFARATQTYWILTTGAGAALISAALLGFIVGAVVVSQTLYATTIDHLPEFVTLRAIGAGASYLRRIILRQAVASAVLGYGIALAVSHLIIHLARDGGPEILLPWQVAGTMFVLSVLMCVSAAIVSIRRVTRIDPGSIFR